MSRGCIYPGPAPQPPGCLLVSVDFLAAKPDDPAWNDNDTPDTQAPVRRSAVVMFYNYRTDAGILDWIVLGEPHTTGCTPPSCFDIPREDVPLSAFESDRATQLALADPEVQDLLHNYSDLGAFAFANLGENPTDPCSTTRCATMVFFRKTTGKYLVIKNKEVVVNLKTSKVYVRGLSLDDEDIQ